MNIKLTLTAVLFITIFTTSCKKDNSPSVAGQKFSDPKGTYIILSAQDWAAVKQNTGGQVSVSISGVTNADSITIAASGDGVAGTNNVTITQGQFAGEYIISFSVSSRQTGTFTASTTLNIYKGTDVLQVPLNSGNLQY